MKDLIELSKNVSKYCVGMEGNVSAKKDNFLYIKASGYSLANLSEFKLISIDFNGKQLSNFDKKPSMELGFHTWLLKNYDINFVAHTHPTKTVSILCSNYIDEFANKRLFPDQVIFNGIKSCIIDYAKPGDDLTQKIIISVTNFINSEGFFPKLILLKNHGIIVCGKTTVECEIISDICEKSAEIFLEAKKINSINFLSENEVMDLISDKKEMYRLSLL